MSISNTVFLNLLIDLYIGFPSICIYVCVLQFKVLVEWKQFWNMSLGLIF